MTTTFSGRRTPMPRVTPPLPGWLPTLADLGVPPLVLLIPGIRRAALRARHLQDDEGDDGRQDTAQREQPGRDRAGNEAP